jgi:hypothetical protein
MGLRDRSRLAETSSFRAISIPGLVNIPKTDGKIIGKPEENGGYTLG